MNTTRRGHAYRRAIRISAVVLAILVVLSFLAIFSGMIVSYLMEH